MTEPRFSTRQGLTPPDADITIRHDAPHEMREIIVDIAEEAGLRPSELRGIACKLLRLPEDCSNWSEYPNVDSEVREKLHAAEWWDVYDFIEAVLIHLDQRRALGTDDGYEEARERFTSEVNKYFRRRGIGWQLLDGRIEMRGPEVLEELQRVAGDLAVVTGRETAAQELREAHHDLSRRPQPDVTGSVQHAVAALECVARDIVGSKDTLGQLVRRNPGLFPPPLDIAVEKLYGYSSEMGRHIQEGRQPSFEDAELVVAVAAALVTHMIRRESRER